MKSFKRFQITWSLKESAKFPTAGARRGSLQGGVVRGGRAVSAATRVQTEQFTFPLRRLVGRPLQITHQHSAHTEVEEQAAEHESGAPPTVLGQQELGDGGEHERPDAAATDGESCGEGPPLVEVVGDDDDGGHVAEREAEAREDAEREEQQFHGVDERRYDESGSGEDGAGYRHLATAVPVGEEAGHRPREEWHGHEQGPDPRSLALPLTEVMKELDEYDAKRERDAVGDQVDHERGEHDNPAPSAVRGSRLGILA